MQWVRAFDLFLFDFDGLLVDTEALHYQAYVMMLKKRGYEFAWSFGQYCLEAQRESNRLKEMIYATFPKLFAEEPSWLILKEEKQQIYQELLAGGAFTLMPGVIELLKTLEKEKIMSCVVTNSRKSQTDFIRQKWPVLSTIPHWVTREEYSQPKPSPEGYLTAISLYGKGKKKIIGFEDTPRGIWALQKTTALPVLIAKNMDREMKGLIGGHFFYFPSFEEIVEDSFS